MTCGGPQSYFCGDGDGGTWPLGSCQYGCSAGTACWFEPQAALDGGTVFAKQGAVAPCL
jgi:hypothetical protein